MYETIVNTLEFLSALTDLLQRRNIVTELFVWFVGLRGKNVDLKEFQLKTFSVLCKIKKKKDNKNVKI